MRTLQRKRGIVLTMAVALVLMMAAVLSAGCSSSSTTTTQASATTQAPANGATTASTGSTGASTATTGSGPLPVVKMQALTGGMGPMILKAIETAHLDVKHGFQGQFNYVDSDAATNTFLLRQNDISVDIDILGVAIARNAGHMVTSFYPVLNNNSSILVKSNSPYKTPKDLIGKKVGQFGTDSGTTSIMTVLLKQLYGINVEKDYKLVTAAPAALVDLLNKGEVDAIFDFSPISENAIVNANARVLFCAAQSGAYAPPLVTVAAYEDWLKGHKELAYDVRAAVDEAYHMFADSQYKLLGEEPYRTLLNQPDAKVVDAVIARANEIPLMTNTWTPGTLASAEQLLKYMADNKVILDKAPPAGSVITLESFLGPQGQ